MLEKYIYKIKSAGLKVTPQRIAVLEAIDELGSHPTADNIIDFIRKKHPGIAIGTVYNVLGVLVEKKLIAKVKTERDIMHYDGILDPHHHLYCASSDRIEDYMDKDLDEMLMAYFQKKGISGFTIEEIKLQIKGEFINKLSK